MGVSITPMVIELALVNNLDTWITVISVKLILLVIISIILSIIVVIWRFRYVRINRWYIYFFIGTVIVLIPTVIVKRLKDPVSARIPYSLYYSFSAYLDNKKIISEDRNTFDNVSVKAQSDSITVILILGESLRADHIPMNGYSRNTMPHLNSDTSIISFPNVYTEAWCTHLSIPHIITDADSIHRERAFSEQSLITLFNKADFNTVWMTNQDAVSTYSYFMHEADTIIAPKSGSSLYNFNKWLDIDLLPELKNILNKIINKQLIVIHSIGSHWWYPSHYPDSLTVFKPEIKSKIISEISDTELINSYDNTIIATDDFIYHIISEIKDLNSIIIYISDHGEALGENGNYLHAADYPQLHNPAHFIWYSTKYAEKYPEKIKAALHNSLNEWNSDIIFHSVIDAADIKTDIINNDLNVLYLKE